MKKIKSFKEFQKSPVRFKSRAAKVLFAKDTPFKPKTIPNKKKYIRSRDKKVSEGLTDFAVTNI